jgi:putative nucleotidyltransferase-like protein
VSSKNKSGIPFTPGSVNAATPDQLIEAYAQVSFVNAYLLKRLESVLAHFHEHGIEVMLLKGADLISRVYGVMGLRPMTDVDLLVHQPDLPAIDRILTDSGYRPSIDGNPVYEDHEHTFSLDLATCLWYLDETSGIWRRAVSRKLGAVPIKGMGPSDLLIYLTAYIVVHRGSLGQSFAQDLELLVRNEVLDWDFVLEEATRHHLRAPLSHGLTYAAARGFAKIPERVLAALAPAGPAEQCQAYLLRKLVTERRIQDLGHFLLFLTQPGWRRWHWLATTLFPSRAFLRYRYGAKAAAHPFLTRLTRPFSLLAEALKLSVRVFVHLIKRTA